MNIYENFRTLIGKEVFTDILGQENTKKQLLSALIMSRHVIIVGPPGIGKTTLAKNVAKLLPDLIVNDCSFNCSPENPVCPECKTKKNINKKKIKGIERFVRIQGSPDLTVEDLLGDIDPIKALKFGPLSLEAFTPGKIFKSNSGVLFFDEVNRAPEKLQNALLQVLEEKKATIGSYDVDFPANFILIGSLHTDEEVLVEQNGILKRVKIGKLVDSFIEVYGAEVVYGSEIVENYTGLKAYSYDTSTKKIKPLLITSFIRHKPTDFIFEIALEKGRTTRITGKHSVFKEENGILIPVEVSKIKAGEKIVIPQKIEHKPLNIKKLDLLYFFKRLELEKPIFAKYGNISGYVDDNREELVLSNNNQRHIVTKFKFYERMPINKVDNEINSKLRNVYLGINGSSNSIKKDLVIDNDICWLIGFFVAEGFTQKAINNKGTYRYNIYVTNKKINLILKTQKIILEKFGVKTRVLYDKKTDAYTLTVSSYCLYYVFKDLFMICNGSEYKKIPPLIFQLSKGKIKYFLKGYLDGDGCYFTKNGHTSITISSTSEMLANDLAYLFLLFGKILSIRKIIEKRPHHKNCYQMYLCNSNYKDILDIKEENNPLRTERIKSIKKLDTNPEFVYDLEVLNDPKTDNFIGGFGGVLLHNSMNPEDFAGTEKLSEVFLDRFDIIYMRYPETLEIEKDIVKLKGAVIKEIKFPNKLLEFSLEFVRKLRANKDVERAPSVRVSLGLYERAQSNALISGRKEVIMQDIQEALISVLSHRIRLKPSIKYLISNEDFIKKEAREFFDLKESSGDFP